MSAKVKVVLGLAGLESEEFELFRPEGTWAWRFACGCSVGVIRLSGATGACVFGSVITGAGTTGAG